MGKKEAYKQKIEAQLDEWKADIDKLKAKADKVKADARVNYTRHIEELKEKQAKARQKLKELEDAGEETWEGMKAGIDKARDELKSSFNKFKEKF